MSNAINKAGSLIDQADISSAALYGEAFEDLLVAFGPDEVKVALGALADDLKSQIQNHDGNADWRKRAGHLLHKVDSRLREVNAIIKQRNKEETATAEAREQKWSSFAERLAKELYLLDPSAMQHMEGPTGDINALDWILIRVEQRARKAQRVEEAMLR